MELVLTAIYEEVPERDGGGYVAYAAELPGAITEGDTLEDARSNLRDSIEELLKTMPSVQIVSGNGDGERKPTGNYSTEQIAIEFRIGIVVVRERRYQPQAKSNLPHAATLAPHQSV